MGHNLAPKPVDVQEDCAFLDLAQGRLASGKQFWALILVTANPDTAAGIAILTSTSASDVANAFTTLTTHTPFVCTVLVDSAAYWRAKQFVSAALNRRITLNYMPSFLSFRRGKVERFSRAYQREVMEGPPLATINVARDATAAWLAQRH